MEQRDPSAWPRMLYGTAWKQEATADLTRRAIVAGFRGIDTANQPQHYDESGAGQGIAAGLDELGLSRRDLFVQTKYSPPIAQGAQVPYDRGAPIAEQAEESLHSSLEHLGTDYLDALLLHAPHDPRRMGDSDWAAWSALEAIQRRGDAHRIGISNVGVGHLRDLIRDAEIPPAAVQNRCFARTGWDRDVREFCREHGIVYQGFSLLTANAFAVEHPEVRRLADTHRVSPAEIVFAFAAQVGMVPLTGTTSDERMVADLAAPDLILAPEEVRQIELLAGG